MESREKMVQMDLLQTRNRDTDLKTTTTTTYEHQRGMSKATILK